MSHHGKKHARKAARRAVCAGCGAPADRSPAGLLGQVAAALNACSAAGVKVRLRHGIVLAREGYVFPLLDGGWAVRPLLHDPDVPASGSDPDDD